MTYELNSFVLVTHVGDLVTSQTSQEHKPPEGRQGRKSTISHPQPHKVGSRGRKSIGY